MMYGAYLFLPRSFEPWKEAKRQLARWRAYEVRLEAPDEASRTLLKQKTFDPEFNTLGALGFEYWGDYVARVGIQEARNSSTAPLASPDITGSREFTLVNLVASRVFIHKGHGCIAFVLVSSSRGRHPLVQIASQGEGWTYTSEADDNVSTNAGRSPRALESYHGAISPEQLLKAHLECRAQIAQVGGFSWGASLTMQEVLIEEEKHAQAARDFGCRHSPLSLLIWEWREKRKGYGDWLGELTGKVSLPKSSTK